MLSKPIRAIIMQRENNHYESNTMLLKNSRECDNIINYQEFFNKNIALKKYKLPELKKMVKYYKLKVTGNKDVLIVRLQELFTQMKCANIIQKVFRSWIVRFSFKLRGEAFKNRNICINNSDFVTLDPLDEIPDELFYSYTDDTNNIYGFNINSLYQVLRTKTKINNPYNRTSFDNKTVKNIISLYSIIQLIYPTYKDESNVIKFSSLSSVSSNNSSMNSLERTNTRPSSNSSRMSITSIPQLPTYNPPLQTIENIPMQNLISTRYFYPNILNVNEYSDYVRRNLLKILDMRKQPVNARIQNLFMEIDNLGNYSQSSWFSNLDRNGLLVLYNWLKDIWCHRAQLSPEIKSNICPLFDPFVNIFKQRIYINSVTYEQIQFVCFTVIENMVYSGIDEDHKKLGTLHALSALTIVSAGARNSMRWLYESITF